MDKRMLRECHMRVSRPSCGVVVPICGRLMPLAVDEAGGGLEATLLSVATGGLSQRQIDVAPLTPERGRGRIAAARACILALLRRTARA